MTSMEIYILYECNNSLPSTYNKKIINNKKINNKKIIKKINNKKNFMAPFYGWGSTASRLQPLRGGSLLVTIQFRGIPGTHFIDLRRMKG